MELTDVFEIAVESTAFLVLGEDSHGNVCDYSVVGRIAAGICLYVAVLGLTAISLFCR